MTPALLTYPVPCHIVPRPALTCRAVLRSEMSAQLDVLLQEQQKLQESLAVKEAEKQRLLAERAAQQEVRAGRCYGEGMLGLAWC